MAEYRISEVAVAAPHYVTCACAHCGGNIEFDANGLPEGETRTVACPHCGLETVLFVTDQQGVPPPIPPVVREGETQSDSATFEVLERYRKAAEQGDAEFQCRWATALASGLGVAKDYIEAAKWFLKAAEQGHPTAQFNAGACCWNGYGVARDHEEGVKWFLRAAEQGDAGAQKALGQCYENGDGVAQDLVEAYKWMKLAAAQSAPGAQQKCDELATELNREQLERAQRRIELITFSRFIGQERIKARLEIAVAAARQRKEALDHILLVGPPGFGKATLAHILAKVMGANLKSTIGSTIEKAGDLVGLLTNLEEGDVLFIDQVQRLRNYITKYLYPAMNDFKLDIIVDQGENARSVRLNLPRFTLIGTMPRKEALPAAFQSCFPIVENMDAYTVQELAAIVCRFAKALEVEIDEGAAEQIARSADGTPLDVLNRLRHVRDYARIKADGRITTEVAGGALKMLAAVEETSKANDGRASIPSEVRREVWRRDGGKCVKCGSRERLEYDHIIPVIKGGSNTARNIELLCESCNRAKSDLIQ